MIPFRESEKMANLDKINEQIVNYVGCAPYHNFKDVSAASILMEIMRKAGLAVTIQAVPQSEFKYHVIVKSEVSNVCRGISDNSWPRALMLVWDKIFNKETT